MKTAILLLIALFCSGCAKERGQAAADARAGIAAAMPHADPVGQQILAGVDARLPAATGVNSVDWPAPTMDARAIEAAPKTYASTAPPEPRRTWLQVVAIASTLGLGALFIIQRAGPFLPYVGPAVGAIMARFPLIQPALNAAWSMASHADEVAADKAKTVVATEAGNLLPIAQAGNAKPELLVALKTLAGG